MKKIFTFVLLLLVFGFTLVSTNSRSLAAAPAQAAFTATRTPTKFIISVQCSAVGMLVTCTPTRTPTRPYTITRTPTRFLPCASNGTIVTCTPTRTATKVLPCSLTSASPTCTPTKTPTKRFTFTKTKTPTKQFTYTATSTKTATKKFTPTKTKTATKKFTPTKTKTPSPTKRFTSTSTRTATKVIYPCSSAAGNIPTCTPTRTATKYVPCSTTGNLATCTPTRTPTKYVPPCSATSNATCTPTPTQTKVFTATATASVTRRPTFTATSSPSQTKVYTATVSATPTPRISETPTKCVDPTTGGDCLTPTPTKCIDPQTQKPCATATATSSKIQFAVVGDYGVDDANEAAVATLINSWNPDFVITTGDNNYLNGEASTIDQNIGQYYQQYIFPYTGTYGTGSTYNQFFPSMGNHDWDNTILPSGQPYTDYFTLPGNERYYDFVKGPVHFFVIDSDTREPDGTSSVSTQALWLQAQLAAATEPWKIVYMHHPPYSSGSHGSTAYMQWNFQGWGADAVLSGHDHTYERLEVNGFPYFVNGLGGQAIYPFGALLPESKANYDGNFGAMIVYADPTQMVFKFIDINGTTIDTKILP